MKGNNAFRLGPLSTTSKVLLTANYDMERVGREICRASSA
jgi:hypothetical protein